MSDDITLFLCGFITALGVSLLFRNAEKDGPNG